MSAPSVVVMGGGTGTFAVVQALKKLPVSITTIIAVSDSGGSTGRIRDEFGFQPVGDLRQSLAALAEDQQENWIQRVLLYRFEKGTGLKGHNLGNLLLTALQDMTGSTHQALVVAQQIFRLQGTVLPVTEENVQLKIHYSDGTTEVGEHILDESPEKPKTIDHVTLTPECKISPDARQAIETADLLLIGPGDYYASIMATLAVPGIKEAFASTKATVVYITNLMTRRTQTHNMTASDHVKGIEQALGRPVDRVLLNTEPISSNTLKLYEVEQEYPVIDDLESDKRAVRVPLASSTVIQKSASDTAHRSLVRHSPAKLAQACIALLDEV